jgi:acetoin utilization deacetylase AcuC-like enzyme
VVYLGGIDVLAGDRFGRLALTRDGLASRDRFVIETVLRQRGLPLLLLLSGGYAATPEETADLHAVMYRQAAAVASGALAGSEA